MSVSFSPSPSRQCAPFEGEGTGKNFGGDLRQEVQKKRDSEGGIRDALEGILYRRRQAVRAAGIELSMYYMAGLGGPEIWREHAKDSAAVLNAVNPELIRIRTYSPMRGTPMGDSFLRGESVRMDPHEVLRELRLLVENLDAQSRFLSDHWLNFTNIHGVLSKDKERMLTSIDQALSLPREAFRPTGVISDSL